MSPLATPTPIPRDANGSSRRSTMPALEAHFVVSRIVRAKSKWVSISGGLTLASMALAGGALLVKTAYG